MRQIYTLCRSIEEANALGHFIMSKGYEGVQNDSYRYCKMEIEMALKANACHHRDYCFVGVNGCQMVVGKNKKEMRKKFSMKYIEKERVFREVLSLQGAYGRLLGKEVKMKKSKDIPIGGTGIIHGYRVMAKEYLFKNTCDDCCFGHRSGFPGDCPIKKCSAPHREDKKHVYFVIAKEVEG